MTQLVEGYSALVTATGMAAYEYATGDCNPLGPDFRGDSLAAWTREWWLPAEAGGRTVAWKTAPVAEPSDTTFVYVGESATLPEGAFPPNEARLEVNGQLTVTFELGVREPRVWRDGELELAFEPRQVALPIGIHDNLASTRGSCGIYRLTVPGRFLRRGEPLELRVVIEPQRTSAITWFALRTRSDALVLTPATNAEQILQLQRELTELKRIVSNLARRSYHALLPERLDTEEVIIAGGGQQHVGFPGACRLSSGDLLLAYREATAHIGTDGKIVLTRSSDGGYTWAERQILLAHEATDWRDAALTQLADGRVILGTWINPFYEPGGRYLNTPSPSPTSALPGGSYLGTSTDEGHTWSFPATPVEASDPWHVTDRILELPSGKLLMAGYAVTFEDGRALDHPVIFHSLDNGMTWSPLSSIESPDGRLNEPVLARTPSGRVVCIMRSEEGATFSQADSFDDGATWTPVRRTPIPGVGVPANLLPLPDGRLLCVYGRRGDPGGIWAVESRDDGDTWEMRAARVIRDDFPNHDSTYPSSLLLEDERVFTAYYFTMFGRLYIGASLFRWP